MLCNESVDAKLRNEMLQGEDDYNKEEVVDNIILNQAARTAFYELRSLTTEKAVNDFDNAVSILTLARADACIANSIRHITLPGKGGNKNTSFNLSFNRLLLLAPERIISQLWRELKEIDSSELLLHIGNSPESKDDPYGNELRNWTTVLRNPNDNYLYLVVTPKFLRNVSFLDGNSERFANRKMQRNG